MVKVLAKRGGGVVTDLRSTLNKGGGIKRVGGGIVKGGDARLKIEAKNRSKITDARDKLGLLAKKTDARQKIEKIRNLKKGKLDVKTTKKGGITITTTTKGLLLTTAKKRPQTQTTANKRDAIARKLAASLARREPVGRVSGLLRAKEVKGGVARNRPSARPVITGRRTAPKNDGRLTRTIMSDSARLDEELLTTRVDPLVLKRTIRQQVQQRRPSPPSAYYRRSPERYQEKRPLFTRHASPDVMDYDGYIPERRSEAYRPAPIARGRYDYDDPRREQEREDEIYRRRMMEKEQDLQQGRTLADKFSETGGNFSSPLQGTKVVVSNLQETVSLDDILELFGEIGALKRVKGSLPGSAEVVYVNKADAIKAVEVYHNRQLDGKPMKCQIVGLTPSSVPASNESKFPAMPRTGREAPHPDMSAVHKALFMDRVRPVPNSSARPQFNVSIPKKGNRY